MNTTEFLSNPSLRPAEGRVVWGKADDGVQLRAGLWPKGDKGTVIIYSGRNEYIEKYGPVALELANCGYATATIDWRGQGLSDRLLPDYLVGHVGEFADYQRDVRVLLDAVRDAEMPKPWYMLAHSMGGAIGLRTIIQSREVNAAVFSAPMWGVLMNPVLRPAAWAVSVAARTLGLGATPMLMSGVDNYVLNTEFNENSLTHDRQMWDFMGDLLHENPKLGLGRPSCHWLHEALTECRWLAGTGDPKLPAWVAVGDQEEVVDPTAISDTIERWPGATVTEFPKCRHEIMMETPDLRQQFFDRTCDFFAANS